MNNSVFGKTMENVRNHRDIKLITTGERRSKLASEPNYHSTKYVSKDLLVMKMRKIEVRMNKPIYLGQAILDISKTLMFEFWYDYIVPKYGDKVKLCYMDTDGFVMIIKTEDFYKDLSIDVDRSFDTSNFNKNDNKPLETGKNKKVLGKFNDELVCKIMTEFCALRAKSYAYKLDDDTEKKKAKGTKKCIVKREIIFKNYVDALFNDKVLIKSQQRFRSDHHKVCTEEVNKISLSSNDDKRIQTFDKVTTYPYGTNTFTVCENEMKYKIQRKKMFNIDLKALRDKSLLLRNEVQALRTNSLLLRNELKELRAVSHDIKTKSYILRTESQMIRNKSVKSEIDIIINSSQKLRKESENTRKESAQILASSQKLREELRVIKEESLQIIERSRKFRKSDKEINDNDEEMVYMEMLNKMIDKVNEFKFT